ncbi:hypothetical protein J5N97_001874 [Dioscorea zingiberensis]|uniref:Uncharacterized protein n=1 Tax=Dioscorea zingiberensis TaxID=325984 RepID=A0A9D5H1W8_9LILI|nr:hypothetical protein J5N97_001874 [Dioscorea zingiberensis]
MWQKVSSLKRKISSPRADEHSDFNACSTSSVAEKGHFFVYTSEGKRFMVPLAYLDNNIFKELLKISEEEFGIPGDGPITLPCDAASMEREERVKAVVDRFVKELKEVLEFDGCECRVAGGEAGSKAELSRREANPQRARVWKRVPSPEEGAGDRDRGRAGTQTPKVAINPRHEERTYVDVIMGQERDGFIADCRRASLENSKLQSRGGVEESPIQEK